MLYTNKHSITFFMTIAGLAAGTTEAVMVVSPMDLIKIRLQVRNTEWLTI